MKKYVMCLMVLVMFAATASALTTTIAIQEGVTGSDGWGMFDGQANSTSVSAWTGYPQQGWSGTAQFYFEVPAELQAPGVVITSAELYLESQTRSSGNTGYGGTYVQLMKYAVDSGTVSSAQQQVLFGGAAHLGIPDESAFTRIGAPNFRPNLTGASPLSEFQRNWEVGPELQASIDDGWVHLPLALMTTRDDGTFYANPYEVYGSGPEAPSFFNAYNDQIWCYEGTGGIPESRVNPKITIDYSIVPEPATMLLLGLGALVLRRRKA